MRFLDLIATQGVEHVRCKQEIRFEKDALPCCLAHSQLVNRGIVKHCAHACDGAECREPCFQVQGGMLPADSVIRSAAEKLVKEIKGEREGRLL